MMIRHLDHPTLVCEVIDEGQSYWIVIPVDADTRRFLGAGVAMIEPVIYALPKWQWEEMGGSEGSMNLQPV